jgi:hypothetical protein
MGQDLVEYIERQVKELAQSQPANLLLTGPLLAS